MDKYEYNLKLEEINRLVDDDNYEDAAALADTIDWKRVRNIRTLCMISEIYEANNRLEDSKEILMKAYRRSQMGRSVLYRLTEVCIKLREFDEAVEYYSEYVNAAPNDNSRYILKYKIYRGRGSSIDDQIAILEEFKEKEYTEKWSYELAKLYHRAGNDKKCIETCDDLILWFRQGKYVIKALELKMSLTELTPMQKAIYDRREEMQEEPLDDEEPKVKELEKVIMEKMPSSQEEALTDSIISETQRELAQAVAMHTAEVQNEAAFPQEEHAWSAPSEMPPMPPVSEPEQVADATKIVPVKEVREARRAAVSRQVAQEIPEAAAASSYRAPSAEAPAYEAPVHETPAYEAPAYDAARLQAELANSMREIVAGIRRPETEENLIEPKNDMSAFENAAADIPNGEKASIDDILLSMSGIEPAATAEPVKPASDAVPAAPVIPEPTAVPIPPVQGRQESRPAPQAANSVPVQPVQTTQAANSVPVQPVQTAQTVNSVPVQPVQTAQAANSVPVQPVQTAQAANSVPVQPVQTAQAVNPAPVQPEQQTQVANTVPVQSAPMQMQGSQAAAQQPAPEQPQNTYRQTGLTRNQQYILGYFATVQGLREQIAAALEETVHKVLLDKTSRSGNLIITGRAGSGRSTLAMRYAKAVSRAKGEKTARIAKIYAEDFNKKDIPSTIAKIAGGTLIIEEAGDLTEEVVNKLSTAMEFRTDGLVIILEDEKGYLKEMLDHHPDFAEKFTCAIDIPIFTNDELVSFGQTYALEEDYRIDEGAISSLYDRIGEMQTPDHPVTVADVKEIVDQAMKHSDRAGIRKLSMILSKKRYDAEDRVVLYAKDFK
ncbi:MAG: hypothetical protein SOZ59_15150 [Candidatus Limivivens sp.]|nr:hypothetical protein [Candidatus Limivivens sp.]